LDIDVTIVDQSALPGAKSAAAEAAKGKLYNEHIQSAGGLFKPFVIETYGRWGAEARNYIFPHLIDRIVTIRGWDRSIASNYWKTRITLASMVTGMSLLINRVKQLQVDRITDDMDDELLIPEDETDEIIAYSSRSG
jgi:hypothetical protein